MGRDQDRSQSRSALQSTAKEQAADQGADEARHSIANQQAITPTIQNPITPMGPMQATVEP